MEDSKKEQKYKDGLQEIDEAYEEIELLKYNEARKMKLDNGLYIDIEKIKDLRNIEFFESKYNRDLSLFCIENKDKKERDFIESKIEEINLRNIERDIMWNLSDDDFCKELRKRFENKLKGSDLTDSELKKHHFFIEQRGTYKPSEFENYNLTLYKQKLNSLPKFIGLENIKSKDKKDKSGLTDNQNALKMVYEKKSNVTEKEYGRSLYNKYCHWSDRNNRTANDGTNLQLRNKIKRFEKVIEVLGTEFKQKAIDEVNILKAHLPKN